MDAWDEPIKFPKLSDETKKLIVSAKNEFFEIMLVQTQLPSVLTEIIYKIFTPTHGDNFSEWSNL